MQSWGQILHPFKKSAKMCTWVAIWDIPKLTYKSVWVNSKKKYEFGKKIFQSLKFKPWPRLKFTVSNFTKSCSSQICPLLRGVTFAALLSTATQFKICRPIQAYLHNSISHHQGNSRKFQPFLSPKICRVGRRSNRTIWHSKLSYGIDSKCRPFLIEKIFFGSRNLTKRSVLWNQT